MVWMPNLLLEIRPPRGSGEAREIASICIAFPSGQITVFSDGRCMLSAGMNVVQAGKHRPERPKMELVGEGIDIADRRFRPRGGGIPLNPVHPTTYKGGHLQPDSDTGDGQMGAHSGVSRMQRKAEDTYDSPTLVRWQTGPGTGVALDSHVLLDRMTKHDLVHLSCSSCDQLCICDEQCFT